MYSRPNLCVDLRRISALLLCELFYSNRELKMAMAEKLCLPVGHGRVTVNVTKICLNRIPDSGQKTASDVKSICKLKQNVCNS